jgi:CBS-domain-containing membrane protein
VAGAVGGAVAIAAMEFLSARSALPLAFIPFATSIVLVMGSPEARPAQPRALVAGPDKMVLRAIPSEQQT